MRQQSVFLGQEPRFGDHGAQRSNPACLKSHWQIFIWKKLLISSNIKNFT